jgi:predicted protein tyrosine phosphatase
MPRIHVCSLARLPAVVAETGASHIVTLIDASTAVERPLSVSAERHLFLGVNDISEPMDGYVHPSTEHVARLIAFLESWDQTRPLVIHCFAGISRSTAAAFISLCALMPERDEAELAQALRAASHIAYPNRLLVRLGDDLLKRDGRMVAAIESIGRGTLAEEGIPFHVAIET